MCSFSQKSCFQMNFCVSSHGASSSSAPHCLAFANVMWHTMVTNHCNFRILAVALRSGQLLLCLRSNSSPKVGSVCAPTRSLFIHGLVDVGTVSSRWPYDFANILQHRLPRMVYSNTKAVLVMVVRTTSLVNQASSLGKNNQARVSRSRHPRLVFSSCNHEDQDKKCRGEPGVVVN